MLYSVCATVKTSIPSICDESWETIAARLTTHVRTPKKEDQSLFCGTIFGGSAQRLSSTAIEISMLILDVDNQVKQNHSEYEPGNKKPLQRPVQIEEVEAILEGYEFVVTTSHNHSASWPRFRIVMPIETPVPASLWRPFATRVLEQTNLSLFDLAIDEVRKTPSQIYYWPSAPTDSIVYAARHQGEWLKYTPEPQKLGESPDVHTGSEFSPFTQEQIATFWAAELPDMIQDGDEWQSPCVLHGGEKNKFYVNAHSGVYYCQSGCKDGGGIYKFVMQRYSKSFYQARNYVHELVGCPSAKFTPKELGVVVKMSSVDEVPVLIDQIAKQGKMSRSSLVKALITVHPELDKETLEEQVTAVAVTGELIAFPKKQLDNIAPDDYGLRLDPCRYRLTERGVYKAFMKGNSPEYPEPPLTDRPIWPGAIGLDLHTEQAYLDLCWVGSKGRKYQKWLPEQVIRNKENLLNLADVPMSLVNVGPISAYLTHAKTTLTSDVVRLTSAAGWLTDEEGDMRFVMPGDSVVEYIGRPWMTTGALADWCEGLDAILSMGSDSYTALSVLGLAAASPMARLTGRRNPVMGLISHSSRGKNRVVEYALTIWTPWQDLRFAAGSTAKGTQDHATLHAPDFPIFIDELQELPKKDPIAIEELFYWAGTGQRRITSSRAQKAVGGERRYGVSFFAAEPEIMQFLNIMQTGAQNRIVTLEGDPLTSLAVSDTLERSARNNYGVAGQAISVLLNKHYIEYTAEIEYEAELFHARGGLRGDDHYTLALTGLGLRIIQEISQSKIDIDATLDWLYCRIVESRRDTRSTHEHTFAYILEAVMSMPWGMSGDKDLLQDDRGDIAWRGKHACDCPLEINPTHVAVYGLLGRLRVRESIAHEWAKRGWVMAQDKTVKWLRSRRCSQSPGAWSWRVTPAGLAQLGVTPEFEPIEKSVEGVKDA